MDGDNVVHKGKVYYNIHMQDSCQLCTSRNCAKSAPCQRAAGQPAARVGAGGVRGVLYICIAANKFLT
jgi:hypothetical protein